MFQVKRQHALAIALIAVLGVCVYFVSRQLRENFESYQAETERLSREQDIAKDKYEAQDVSQKSVEQQQADIAEVVADSAKLVAESKEIKPEDLLPNDDAADQWASVNPIGVGSLELKNMVESAQHLGVDTQSNSLRNANQQLRSEPPNPIQTVSIWNNSTMGPDMFRRPLEIN